MIDERCSTDCQGKAKIEDVKRDLKKVNFKETTDLFKMLAEENRAKIIFSLIQAGELCVHDLSSITGMTTANTSHHLRTLHAEGLVKFRKDGRLSQYSLNDERLEKVFLDSFTMEREKALYV